MVVVVMIVFFLLFYPPCTLDLLLNVLYSLLSCPLYSLFIFVFNFVSCLLNLLPMFFFFYFILVWPLPPRLLFCHFHCDCHHEPFHCSTNSTSFSVFVTPVFHSSSAEQLHAYELRKALVCDVLLHFASLENLVYRR